MIYLVTGAAGQLGSEWVRYLEEDGREVIAFGSSEMDITDEQAVRTILDKYRPDVVINCAAYTRVDRAEEEPDRAFAVNEHGVENLVAACRQTGAKLVHYSTDYVFPGKSEDAGRFPAGYPEDAETAPPNVYGSSKRAGEKVLETSASDWLLIRVAWLCGPKGSNFVSTMLRLASERDEVQVVNDQIGCPSFTFDVVEKTDRLLQMNETGIWHIRSDGEISWADLARETFRLQKTGTRVREIPSSEFPMAADRPMFSLLSIQKMKDRGLTPLPWKKGLQELLMKKQTVS
jgi:dTDP-4-dehydrorhamnose reductase